MIPLHVFSVNNSQASSVRIGGNPEDYLSKFPSYSYDFTVYGWDLDSLPIFPPYIKPLIFIQQNSFPYTTKLVDVVYSIFPSPDNSQKIAVYRRPARNTIPVYFYKTSDGVKVSLTELDLEPAMELHRVFMPMKSYSKFSDTGSRRGAGTGGDRTCVPVDGEFSNSASFNECVKTARAGTKKIVLTSTNTTNTTNTGICWAGVISATLLVILIVVIIWKLITV